MQHDDVICASLPMTQMSFTAWYCHPHQAWCGRTTLSLQTGEDNVEVLHTDAWSLGPFDGAEALLVLAAEGVNRAAHRVRCQVV